MYNPALPNPVLHLSSREFCQHAAGVYAANGIHSHILPPDSKRYIPTPELSFTIRHLQAHGGLNMTASHNPPDDNGSKFYDDRGSQPVPPDDQLMSDFVDQVTTIKHVAVGRRGAQREGALPRRRAAPGVHRAVPQAEPASPPPKADEIRVVFTPLHGCGGFCAGETLEAQGFRPIPVPEQVTPDGQFPNVTEDAEPGSARVHGPGRARRRSRRGADLVIATDPDADRIGGMACTARPTARATFRFLTGNEIAALLTHFKLAQLARAGRRCRRRRSSSRRR